VAKAIKNDFPGIASMIGSNGRSGWEFNSNLIFMSSPSKNCRFVLKPTGGCADKEPKNSRSSRLPELAVLAHLTPIEFCGATIYKTKTC
jgi:hypothetical protein